MVARLSALLELLAKHHGALPRPVPRGALEWILWENAGYLVDDARREEAFEALRALTELDPARILAAPRAKLLEVAKRGGILPGTRVEKWHAIAGLVQKRFGGDLGGVLALPLEQARRELKRFPGIGAPGADKILLFTGAAAVPALESNGLRALVRLGLAEEGASYAVTYRSGIAALEKEAKRGAPWLTRAFELLRAHGQELCKRSKPLCTECPLVSACRHRTLTARRGS